MEGHPDNVAPAIFGGLALSWQDSDQYSSTCAPWPPRSSRSSPFRTTNCPPKRPGRLLPASVGHHAAAMNSGRAALLIHALTQTRRSCCRAREDYLHQSYRAQAMRPSAELIGALRAAGHAAFVSGAGPTVLVLANGAAEAAASADFIAGRHRGQHARKLRLARDDSWQWTSKVLKWKCIGGKYRVANPVQQTEMLATC